MTVSVLPQGTGVTAVEGYAATLQHLALLRARRDRLQAMQSEAEAQHLQRLSCAFALNLIDMDALAVAYTDYKSVSDPGFSARWNAVIPVSAARIQSYIKISDYHRPNGPYGTWEGSYPFGSETTPFKGTNVVYVLFDEDLVPCYVGSTMYFRSRIKRHAADGKIFRYWRAHPCADRLAAYELESQLLQQHKPYLNKKASA